MTGTGINPLTMLLRRHVADILGVKDRTVSDYLEESKPNGRYAGHPLPEPAGYFDASQPAGWVPAAERRSGLVPFWTREQEPELRRWRAGVPARRRRM